MKQFSYFCCVASIVSSSSDSSTSFASIPVFSPPSSANMSLSPPSSTTFPSGLAADADLLILFFPGRVTVGFKLMVARLLTLQHCHEEFEDDLIKADQFQLLIKCSRTKLNLTVSRVFSPSAGMRTNLG